MGSARGKLLAGVKDGRKQFPTIITHNYARDMRVVRLLRQRGFGNSSTQLHKKLVHDLFLALSF